MNYYNENDPFAAEWLRMLIMMGEIPDGYVDERSIVKVQPDSLKEFSQCHFFAGIGGWAYALQLAGVSHDRPLWTGSCPCQPFSVAGKQKGNSDERHLWPIWFNLIKQCKPDFVIGEQVEGAIKHGWLDGIQTDLEKESYAVGHCVLGAHSVGAPHIRQRLYWLAHSLPTGRPKRWSETRDRSPTGSGEFSRMADANMSCEYKRTPSRQQPICHVNSEERDGLALPKSQQQHGSRTEGRGRRQSPDDSRLGLSGGEQMGNAGQSRRQSNTSLGMGDPNNKGPQGRRERSDEYADQFSPWAASEFIQCADGKARRSEPSIFPLAHGVPNRMGTLRGSGNAIVPQIAAEFISAFLAIENQL